MVDTCISYVASTDAGFTRDELRRALAPAQPMAWGWPAAFSAWGLPTPSSSVTSTLQVLDVSCCRSLVSIEAVRSCAQLRCLRMAGGVTVSDLSPLAGCSQLEKLWMAGNAHVASLAPLQACPRLRKLDLSQCQYTLHEQVAFLKTSCTRLAHPWTVVMEGLLNELHPSMPDAKQALAASALHNMARSPRRRTDLADACVVNTLVQLLGQDSPQGVQAAAADAVTSLAADHAQNQSSIADAGALPLLMQLLRRSVAPVQAAAAAALSVLAAYPCPISQYAYSHKSPPHLGNQRDIAAAGAIPRLVHLLVSSSYADVQEAAAGALNSLAFFNAENQTSIASAGAIPPLVMLLGRSADV